ncbi:Hypothetical predicted protein [Octopus vulgaris]|uniref:Uncharacterized protein n=2 Tax=Octopus TaxID=6643 RepID=A0AA36BWL4_OCTVU|nr:transmembrane protein 98-like [Octopus sinensis]XP_036370480.1 transmembrane protein 98-like [Octopus sinensis]CAI9741684.1 Hypothetical predicted protein [Octopus vulgaris]
MESLNTVVALAIGILAAITIAAVVALVVVCKNCHCRHVDLITMMHKESSPSVQLLRTLGSGGGGDQMDPEANTVELDDIDFLNTKLEEVLRDEHYIEDATGLVPHCIAILKTCHYLTNKLVAMAMSSSQQIHTVESMNDIVAVTKRICPRVDDVVRSMYPPLDPRLLEARCTALVLSLNHLVCVVKNAYSLAGTLDWTDQSLADVEDHLKVLKEASVCFDMNCCLPSVSSTEENHNTLQQPIILPIQVKDESSQV